MSDKYGNAGPWTVLAPPLPSEGLKWNAPIRIVGMPWGGRVFVAGQQVHGRWEDAARTRWLVSAFPGIVGLRVEDGNGDDRSVVLATSPYGVAQVHYASMTSIRYGLAPSGGMVYRPTGNTSDPLVKRSQDILAFLKSQGLGIGPLERDGLLGPHTTAAVRVFQTDVLRRGGALTVSGVLDEPTIRALEIAAPAALAAGFLQSSHIASTHVGGTAHAAVAATRGTHPKVDAIVTAATTTAPASVVTVPESVSKMMPPSTVAQLQTMPAPQVQSFVNSLVEKVQTGEARGNDVIDAGSGKAPTVVEITAVPVVGPNGQVTAGISAQPAATGWWGTLTDTEKAMVGIGGTVAGLGTIALLVWIARGDGGDDNRKNR